MQTPPTRVVALVTQVFGWLLVTFALPRLPAFETLALILLQPMLAIIWARLLFEETLLGAMDRCGARARWTTDLQRPRCG